MIMIDKLSNFGIWLLNLDLILYYFYLLGFEDTIENAAKTMLIKDTGGYSCSLCGKHSSDLTKAKGHLEAKHFPSTTGYSCEVCNKWCKTKNALACHVSQVHRKNNRY